MRAFDGSSLVAVIGDEVTPVLWDLNTLFLLEWFRTPSLGFCWLESEREMSKEKLTSLLSLRVRIIPKESHRKPTLNTLFLLFWFPECLVTQLFDYFSLHLKEPESPREDIEKSFKGFLSNPNISVVIVNQYVLTPFRSLLPSALFSADCRKLFETLDWRAHRNIPMHSGDSLKRQALWAQKGRHYDQSSQNALWFWVETGRIKRKLDSFGLSLKNLENLHSK